MISTMIYVNNRTTAFKIIKFCRVEHQHDFDSTFATSGLEIIW